MYIPQCLYHKTNKHIHLSLYSVEAMEPTSLSVPFVQEIAKEALDKVPERYIGPQHERPILSTSTATPLPQVPVIDMSKLLSHDLKGPELEKLHYACKDWGFFQVCHIQIDRN